MDFWQSVHRNITFSIVSTIQSEELTLYYTSVQWSFPPQLTVSIGLIDYIVFVFLSNLKNLETKFCRLYLLNYIFVVQINSACYRYIPYHLTLQIFRLFTDISQYLLVVWEIYFYLKNFLSDISSQFRSTNDINKL